MIETDFIDSSKSMEVYKTGKWVTSWTEVMWTALGVDKKKYLNYSYCTFIRFHQDSHGRIWAHIDEASK